MSVTIELLEYKYKQDNNLNWSNDANNLIGWTTDTGVTISNSSATTSVKFASSGNAAHSQYMAAKNNITLTNGNTYKLTYNVVGYTNNGSGNSKVFVRGNAAARS